MNAPDKPPPSFWLRPVPCPPRRGKRTPPILYPKGGAKVDVIVLEDTIQGFLSHWWHGSPMPCVGLERGCVACDAGKEARWYGYLPSLWLPGRQPRLMAITWGAYCNNTALQALDGKLRGAHLRFERMRASNQAPVRCTILGTEQGVQLPASWHVAEALATLWRLEGFLKAMKAPLKALDELEGTVPTPGSVEGGEHGRET